MSKNGSVAATIIGILLVIGGIIGIVHFQSIVNNPFFKSNFRGSFEFGGCDHQMCTQCGELSVILALSIIALIVGVTMGVLGVVRLQDNKNT